MSSLVTFSDFKWVLWLSLLEPSVQPPSKMTVWQSAALPARSPSGLRCFCVSAKPSLSLPVLVQGLSHFRCLLHPRLEWEVFQRLKKTFSCVGQRQWSGGSELFPANAVYYSLCAWFDIQVISKQRAGESLGCWAKLSRGGRHFRQWDITGVWGEKDVSE